MKKRALTLLTLGLGAWLYAGTVVVVTSGPIAVAIDVHFRFDHEGGGGTGYNWNYGDGTTEITTNNQGYHAYAAAGTYTVTCVRQGDPSEMVMGTTTVTVVDSRRLDASPSPPRANQAVAFSAQNFSGGLRWDFGDGASASGGASQSHVYAAPGNFRVRVWQENTREESALALNLAVLPDLRQVTFSGPDDVFEGSEVIFEARGFTGADLQWDFGDGTVVRGGLRLPHTFPRPGTFTVQAVEADGNSLPLLTRVRVLRDDRGLELKSGVAFAGSECEIEAQNFRGDAVSWDLGDGTLLNGPALLKHRYAAPGAFRVRAVDFAGRDSKVFEKTVQVETDNRVLGLPAEVIAGEEIAMQLQNAGGGSFNWRFSDGESRSGPELRGKVFRSFGPQKVTVSDPSGKYPPLERTIQVVPDTRSLKASAEFILPQEAVSFTAANFRGPGIRWDFGDGTRKENGAASESHSFKALGRYRVQAVDFNGGSSKPFHVDVVVAEMTPGFEVSTLELAFDGGKYYRVVARNGAAPGYQLRVKAKGHAVLAGSFLLDGQSIGLFQLIVQENQVAVLPKSQMTALPVTDLGLHQLTFAFSNYSFTRRIPFIKYFVSAVGTIDLVAPAIDAKVPLADKVQLRWACPQKKPRFEIAFSDKPLPFLDEKQIAWLPVGAEPAYLFDPASYKPGDWIYWQVRLLNEGGQVQTLSEIFSFRLAQ